MTLAQKKIIPAHVPVDFEALLERVHTIGAEVICPAAIEVDRDARFPTESFAALRAEKLLSCYVPVEFGGITFTPGAILTSDDDGIVVLGP